MGKVREKVKLTRTLIPNPTSPEMPMVEILMATAYNSGHTASLRNPLS